MTPRSKLIVYRCQIDDTGAPGARWQWHFEINGRVVARGVPFGYARRRFAVRGFKRMRDRILTGEYVLPTKVAR